MQQLHFSTSSSLLRLGALVGVEAEHHAGLAAVLQGCLLLVGEGPVVVAGGRIVVTKGALEPGTASLEKMVETGYKDSVIDLVSVFAVMPSLHCFLSACVLGALKVVLN